jgi:hypothetical protein
MDGELRELFPGNPDSLIGCEPNVKADGDPGFLPVFSL